MSDPLFERIVVFAPNWLGDAVMALPALADVRRRFPASRLAVAGRSSVIATFRWVDGVDEVVTLGSSRGPFPWSGVAEEAGKLGDGRFDLAVLFPNSFRSAWLASRAGIPHRWGYSRDARRFLLTKAVKARARGAHQSAYYQSLTAALGMENGPPVASLTPPAGAEPGARSLLKSLGWREDAFLVGMAPGAAYGHAKRWLPERFAELVHLVAEGGGQSVLVGSKGDIEAGTSIEEALTSRRRARSGNRADGMLLNAIGRTDLETLAGVMRLCGAFVSNDSGAMHLAAALGVPLAAIFGASDERGTAPLAPGPGPANHVILTARAWCRPCMLRECPIDHRCMSRIGAREVYEVVQRLRQSGAEARGDGERVR